MYDKKDLTPGFEPDNTHSIPEAALQYNSRGRSVIPIGETNANTLECCRYYKFRGWAIIPVPVGEKKPIIPDWPSLRIGENDLPNYFGNGSNIGLLLGEVSGGLIDVDLDCEEALKLASTYLPNTDLVHGRASKPDSHRYYKAESPLNYKKFTDPDSLDVKHSTIVETRTGPGQQTIVPPSSHPSGEKLYWSRNGEPSVVDGKELQKAVAKLAACVVIARHWPKQGHPSRCSLGLIRILAQRRNA
jgi:hypothetical protein